MPTAELHLTVRGNPGQLVGTRSSSPDVHYYPKTQTSRSQRVQFLSQPLIHVSFPLLSLGLVFCAFCGI